MQAGLPKKKQYTWLGPLILIWLVINIRVAIGISTTFERAVDGIVGVVFIMAAIYFALDFFQLIGDKQRTE